MMKKIIHHALLFVSPLFLLAALELFVLPINAFNYRSWEALSVYSLTSAQFLVGRGTINRLLTLPGPFYPNRELTMTEQGDLGFHTRYAREKKVKWVTDRYGFRVADRDGPWDVVIIGDSFVVCPGVTQDQTLAAALARKTGRSVYPYSLSAAQFFRERRFRERPPKILVFASVERNYVFMGGWSDPDAIVPLPEPATAGWRTWPLVQADRFRKAAMWRFVRAGIKRTLVRAFIDNGEPLPPNVVVAGRGPWLFLAAGQEPPPAFDQLSRSAEQAAEFSRLMKNRGVRVIVMPIPDKATIYSDRLSDRPKSDVPNQFGMMLARNGVEAVILQPAFAAARLRGEDTYFSDDTHWNERGIAIAADLLASRMSGK